MGCLGRGHVTRSTVSDWLHYDRLPPHSPLRRGLILTTSGPERSLTALTDTGRTMTVTPRHCGCHRHHHRRDSRPRRRRRCEPRHAALGPHHLAYVARLLRQAKFTSAAAPTGCSPSEPSFPTWPDGLSTDTGEHGLSQRYFTNRLHATHTAGDRSVGVYLLAYMSSSTVIRGRLADGIDLGRVARDAVELANAA